MSTSHEQGGGGLMSPEKEKKKKKMSTSHEPGGGGLMSKLPNEIFLDILHRGSIKTLHHCRFVCKSWYFTIKNPSFITTYNKLFHHNDGNSCFILQKLGTSQLVDRNFETFTLKLPQLPNMNPTDCSCNGLLLLITRVFINSYTKHFSYYICNPITGDHIAVPKSPWCVENDDLTIGFGYDPVSKVCKLVRILSVYDRVRGNYVTKVEICDIVRGKWRLMVGEELLTKSLYNSIDPPNASLTGKEITVSLDSIELISSNFQPCAFVNGAIHWLGYRKGSGDLAIITFKLDTEEFYHVLLPFSFNLVRNDLSSSERQPYLLVVRGCLSLVLVLVQCVDYHECVEIWVMKDYGLESSWEKQYVISNVVMDNGDLIRGRCMPLEVMQSGEILLVCPRSKKMGCYQPVTKKVKVLEFIDRTGCYWRPLLHVCSLISPGEFNYELPAERIWYSQVPLKVQFFLWYACRNRLTTTCRLQRLGFHMASKCHMCNDHVEDTDHLLISCYFANTIWSSLRANFDCDHWDNSTIEKALESWNLKSSSRAGKTIWKALFHATVWCLWKERNLRIFEDKFSTVERVVDQVKMTTWSWVSDKPCFKGIFFDMFMVNWVSIVNNIDP